MNTNRLDDAARSARRAVSKSGTSMECFAFSVIGIALMAAVVALTGCSDASANTDVQPEFAYVSESLPLPDEMHDIKALTCAGNKLFTCESLGFADH